MLYLLDLQYWNYSWLLHTNREQNITEYEYIWKGFAPYFIPVATINVEIYTILNIGLKVKKNWIFHIILIISHY